jgi:purine catabolism regulator
MKERDAMDIAQLLNQKELQPIKIVAGKRAKHRQIRTITMMDAPDIIPYLNPDQFIITTAYHLKNNLAYFKELIIEMAKKECAGIGIKKNRFLYEFPKDILELADELEVPFIELPEHLSLGEINLIVTQFILHSEAALLTYAMNAHRQFTDIIFKGQGINQLVKHLSSLIKREVYLINSYLCPYHSSQQYIQALASIQKMMEHHFEIPIFSTSSWHFSLLDDRSTYSFFPININSGKHFLLIEGMVEPNDTQLRLLIEQAINVLSFAILQEKALQQQKRKIRNQQFSDLLEIPQITNDTIKSKAEELHIPLLQAYVCIVGRLRHIGNLHPYQMQQLLDQIHSFCEESLQSPWIHMHIFTVKNDLVFLYELQYPEMDFKLFITELFKELSMSIKQYFHQTISFGASNMIPNFFDIHRAMKEAQSAVHFISSQSPLISFYTIKEIDELLQMIPENDLRNYQQMIFKPLLALPMEEQQILFETLYEYLENHCQISETAKKLFVHRNTVIYRLEKCSALLQKDLKDPEVTIQLRLALRIRNHLILEQ